MSVQVQVTAEEDQLRLKFPYSPATIQHVKMIPGRKYDPQTKTWTIPKAQYRRFTRNVAITVVTDHPEVLQNLQQFTYSPIPKVDGFTADLYPFQAEGVGFLVARERSLLADEMGCLSGEALIPINRRGAGKKIRLKALYERFNGLDAHCKWIASPTYARSLVNGFLHLEEIAAVIYSGKKQTFEVTTEDGYSVRATADHPFITPNGEIPLSKLEVGTEVFTNGTGTCVCCGQQKDDIVTYKYAKFKGYCKRCMFLHRESKWKGNREYFDSDGYVIVSGMQNHPFARRQGALKHRLVYEAYLNGVPYAQWVEMVRFKQWPKNAIFLKPTDVVHHKDENKENNALSNLELFPSGSSHMETHGSNGIEHRLSVFFPKKSRVKSITNRGIEDVYDVKTKGPAHNFVANGFVVHNCGKTIQLIAAALELRKQGKVKRVLVFSPKTIITQWTNEFKKFTGETATAITGSAEQRALAFARAENSFLVVTNYETVLRDTEKLVALKPDLVVLDEAQRIGGYENRTTQLIKEHFQTPYRIALSGTPLQNALSELHSILDWIEPSVLGPWWVFKREYIVYGGFKGKQIIGSRNLPQLHDQIKDWMLRRRKADVLKDLPPVTMNNYYVDLDKEEHDLYEAFRTKLMDHYKNFKRSQGKSDSGDILGSLVYLRECCDHTALISSTRETSTKLTELHRIITDLGDEKVVVFTEYERMLQLIARSLSCRYATLYGAMDQETRVNAINYFVKYPECKVFISTEAGGIGVNLQVASTIINYDLPWNPGKLQQRIGRLHRIGQKNTVTCLNLVAKNTIEEHVLEVLAEKTDLFRKVVDGDFSAQSDSSFMWNVLRKEFQDPELDNTEPKLSGGLAKWC